MPRRRRTYILAALAIAAIAVWATNASTVGRAVTAAAFAGTAAAESVSQPIRVVSLNMLHEFPFFRHLDARVALILKTLRDENPDIVCLQEVPWTRALGNVADYLARELNMNYVYNRTNGNRWCILFETGEAILSRYPLEGAQGVEVLPAPGPFQHRTVLYASAKTPQGPLGVFVTHLTGGREKGIPQTQFVIDFVARTGVKPAIITGDFNANEPSQQMVLIRQHWTDLFRVAHSDDKGRTCCADDITAGPEQPYDVRYDYIFLANAPNQDVHVSEIRRVFDAPVQTVDGWLWPSDHAGMLAVLDFRHAETGS